MKRKFVKICTSLAFLFAIQINYCIAQKNKTKSNVSSTIDVSGLFDNIIPIIKFNYEHELTESNIMFVDVFVSVSDNEGLIKVLIDEEEFILEKAKNFNKVIKTPNNHELNVRAIDINNNEASMTELIQVTIIATLSKKLALVIGNSAYEHSAPLRNPKNDALAMSSTLEELGFEVIQELDATKDKMMDAFKEFSSKISDVGVALFYYAGHGMQVESKNYLIPIDAEYKNGVTDVEFESINVEMMSKVMNDFGGSDRLNLMILDACRNNPYRTWTRGGETGLASMPAPSGTLIAYSTSPGSVASDGDGANGLYTGELIKQLKISQRIEDVFINTRNEVERLSNGRQSPWELARLKGRYFLK